jgi:hypothetical protein
MRQFTSTYLILNDNKKTNDFVQLTSSTGRGRGTRRDETSQKVEGSVPDETIGLFD